VRFFFDLGCVRLLRLFCLFFVDFLCDFEIGVSRAEVGEPIFPLRGSSNRRIEAGTVPFTTFGVYGKFPFTTLGVCGIFRCRKKGEIFGVVGYAGSPVGNGNMQKCVVDKLGSGKTNTNLGLKKPNSTHWCPINLTNAKHEVGKEIEKMLVECW